MGMNGANTTVSQNFQLLERTTLETSIRAHNIFNHQVLGSVDTTPPIPTLDVCSRIAGQAPMGAGRRSKAAFGFDSKPSDRHAGVELIRVPLPSQKSRQMNNDDVLDVLVEAAGGVDFMG